MNSFIERIFSKIKADKKMIIIVLVGLSGLVLLAASEIFDKEDKGALTEETTEESVSFNEYEKNIEERLEVLLESINGAGDVKVMVTVESNDEKIYATETSKSENKEEKRYVLIDSDGNDSGLLLKITQPEIRGVGVVCQGAETPQVRQEITATVTAVLGISSNRVNISKMKTVSGG